MTVRLMNQNRGVAYSLDCHAENYLQHFFLFVFTLLCLVRFAVVAEAEVVEGDLGEEADSVEIRTEDYNSKGEKM